LLDDVPTKPSAPSATPPPTPAGPHTDKLALARALHANKRLAANLVQLFRTLHQLACDYEAAVKSKRSRVMTARDMLRLMLGECFDVLDEHGLQPFAPSPGDAFSAAACEAVVTVPASPRELPGRVVAVHTPGYRSHITGDIVIKARVTVAVAVPEQPTT
jgi:hypothetical protein